MQELTAPMGYIKPPKGAHYNCKLASNEDFGLQETKIIHIMTNLQVYGCQAHVFMGCSLCARLPLGITVFQMYTEATPSRTIQMVIQNMRTVPITLKKHTWISYCVLTTKVMDLEFNPPDLEMEEKDMEDVIDTLAGLPYE